ncbi:MAG: sulfatase-like hydrolase/transferase, partial [Pseudomonadota bacterium]
LQARAQDETPWCLYVGLVAPHFPLVCPEPYFGIYPPDSLPPVKAHPSDGHQRHPWVERLTAFDDSEAKFTDRAERLSALCAYYGLISWLDHNVGQILAALEASGLSARTRVIYTSDHGDNAGARGLWGKSTMYEESAAIPLILSDPDLEPGICHTPVSLVDISHTIAGHFGAELSGGTGASLFDMASAPYDPDRVVFSEYHAAGAASAAYMIRKGRWKLIEYLGFAPELFDLETDPEEMVNRADDPTCLGVLQELRQALAAICDPIAVDAQAHADQEALIAAYGGLDKAIRETMTIASGTPPPSLAGDR